jgi:outer membrane protein OmpA-like peptidoglycan-associated protein
MTPVALAVLALDAGPALAQNLFANNSSIRLDLSVLEQLGPAPTVPSLLNPERVSARIVDPLPSSLARTAPASRPGKAVAARPAAPKAAKPSRTASAASPAKGKGAKTTPVSVKTEEPPAPVRAVQTPVIAEPSVAAPPVPAISPPTAIVRPPSVETPKIVEAPPPPAPALPEKPAEVAPPAAPPLPAPGARPGPAQAAPKQTASLPDAGQPVEGGDLVMQIVFGEGATKVPDGSLANLKGLADRMNKNEALRLQLLAYAESNEANASKARRLSLSRALDVRSRLIDMGVRSTRIDVRALGNKAPSGPGERVDVVLLK